MAYASITDLQARLVGTGRELSASSKPTVTQATQWLTDAEGRINAALAGAGLDVPIADANGILVLKDYACDYAEARCRMAHAAAGGDGSNDDGKDSLKRFDDFIAWIHSTPAATVSAELGGGTASSSTVFVRSHVTHDVEGRASDHADFDPQFTKARGADQF